MNSIERHTNLGICIAEELQNIERVGIIAGNGRSTSSAYDIVKKYTEEKVGKFTGAEIVAHCPGIGRSSVLAALEKLVDEGIIIRYGSGRGTYYVKADKH